MISLSFRSAVFTPHWRQNPTSRNWHIDLHPARAEAGRHDEGHLDESPGCITLEPRDSIDIWLKLRPDEILVADWEPLAGIAAAIEQAGMAYRTGQHARFINALAPVMRLSPEGLIDREGQMLTDGLPPDNEDERLSEYLAEEANNSREQQEENNITA